jgi:hypothetical protein
MADEIKPTSKWDILAKLLPGIGAIIAGVLIPLLIHINGEENRKNQLYIEIVSKRESADSDLRARMFENLIKNFYGDSGQKKSHKENLIMLRLLALNFHESFDLKPIFEGIDDDLTREEKTQLREIAREIRGKQEAMLSHVKEGMIFDDIVLYEGSENGIMLPPLDKPSYKKHRLGIELVRMQNDDYAILHVMDTPEGNINVGNVVDITFKLSPYDMPFIDNTKLFDSARFAMTLKEFVKDENGKQAVKMKIIFFPENYMSSRDRPYLDEMLKQLMSGKKKE